MIEVWLYRPRGFRRWIANDQYTSAGVRHILDGVDAVTTADNKGLWSAPKSQWRLPDRRIALPGCAPISSWIVEHYPIRASWLQASPSRDDTPQNTPDFLCRICRQVGASLKPGTIGDLDLHRLSTVTEHGWRLSTLASYLVQHCGCRDIA